MIEGLVGLAAMMVLCALRVPISVSLLAICAMMVFPE